MRSLPVALVTMRPAAVRDDQRRHLRHEAVTDGEQRVRAGRLRQRHALLHDADEDAADDVDGDDEHAEDRVALHVLGGAVHRAVEVGGARDLVAAGAGFLLVDQAGRRDRRRSPSACRAWRRG